VKTKIGQRIFARGRDETLYSSRLLALAERVGSEDASLFLIVFNSYYCLIPDGAFYLERACSKDSLISASPNAEIHTSLTGVGFAMLPVKTQILFDETQDWEEAFSAPVVGQEVHFPKDVLEADGPSFYVSSPTSSVLVDGQERHDLISICVYGEKRDTIAITPDLLGARCGNMDGVLGIVVAICYDTKTIYLDRMRGLSTFDNELSALRFANANRLFAWNAAIKSPQRVALHTPEELVAFLDQSKDRNWSIEDIQRSYIDTIENSRNSLEPSVFANDFETHWKHRTYISFIVSNK
jgi:hypothetical protein